MHSNYEIMFSQVTRIFQAKTWKEVDTNILKPTKPAS